MKQNFTDAHQELRDIDATVNELGFHSTKAIVSQIAEQLRDEVPTNNANPSPDFQTSPPPGYPPETPPPPPTNPSDTDIEISSSI